jgi:hypothetical protein
MRGTNEKKLFQLIGERSELITFAASAEHERTGFD